MTDSNVIDIPLSREDKKRALKQAYYAKKDRWQRLMKSHDRHDPRNHAEYMRALYEKNEAHVAWLKFIMVDGK